MNALLERLGLEAKDYAYTTVKNYRAQSTEFERVYIAKFAELIVKECVGITDELVNRDEDGTWTSNELYTDYNGALFEVKRQIEQHFGTN